MPKPTEPDRLSVLEAAAASAVARVNVALPATVTAYDHDTQTATVQVVPSFRKRLNGTVTLYRPDPIANVPVLFSHGSGGDYSDTWPLAAGDHGIAIFSDRSLDEWKSTGAASVDPQDTRRHAIMDALFVPQGRPIADPIAADGLDAAARVIKASALKLGDATASDFVALASLVSSNLTALETIIQTAVAAGVAATVPGDGGAASFAAMQASLTTQFASWPTSVASSKVKSL